MGVNSISCECCIIGAGPAGIAAALELTDHSVRDVVIVDKQKTVGGLARTEEFAGARFDVGPHRFFTKNAEINRMWHATLKEDFIPVRRMTRIFYKDHFYSYPINGMEVLGNLGLVEAGRALLSYAAASAAPKKDLLTFEDWITKKFGRKLYEAFFKTYTEKVWGIPCSEIGADWAAQRIKGLDIVEVAKKALNIGQKKVIKTLVDEFHYPIRGTGQMYDVMSETLAARGARFMLGLGITSIEQNGGTITAVTGTNADGSLTRIEARHYFISLPFTHFFRYLSPAPAPDVLRAADTLYYRDHITVDILVDRDDLFPDQWIYIHSPEVRMARLANYCNFSRAMAPRGKSSLSVEYFSFQHEELWKMSDSELSELAAEELHSMGLIKRETVEASMVVRETECYPTYYLGFREPYMILRNAVDKFTNAAAIGRGGMYKYSNQDHAAMSGLLAARNYLRLPGSPYILWNINIDAEYHEGAAANSIS